MGEETLNTNLCKADRQRDRHVPAGGRLSHEAAFIAGSQSENDVFVIDCRGIRST